MSAGQVFAFDAVYQGWQELAGLAGVYAIRHIPTGAAYVGKSKSLNSRIAAHAKDLKWHKHSNKPLLAAFVSGSPSDFQFEVLEVLAEGESAWSLRLMERKWVERLHSIGKVFNGIYDLPPVPGTRSAVVSIRFPSEEVFQQFSGMTAIERGELIARAITGIQGN